MQHIILQGIKLEDFLQQIEKIIESKVNEKLDQLKPKSKWEYLGRKEVARLLKISLVTLTVWAKEGVLPSYRIGKRVLFKSDEVHDAVKARRFRSRN